MSASPAAAPGSYGQALPVGNPNVVTAPGNNNHERPMPTAEHDKITPRVMPLAAALMNNKEYTDVNGDTKRYVQTSFLNITEGQLDPLKSSCDQLGRVARYPGNLFKVLDIVTSGPPRSTRDAYTDIVKVLTGSKEVIPALKVLYELQAALEGDNIMIYPFMQWCHAAKKSLTFFASRCRLQSFLM